MKSDAEQKQFAEKLFSPNNADYVALSECVLSEIQFTIDHEDELKSGDKNAPTLLARFDRIVNKSTRDKAERELTEGASASSSTAAAPATNDTIIVAPRAHMPTDVENEVGGEGDIERFILSVEEHG